MEAHGGTERDRHCLLSYSVVKVTTTTTTISSRASITPSDEGDTHGTGQLRHLAQSLCAAELPPTPYQFLLHESNVEVNLKGSVGS